ncbi:MAG TPA: acetyl-CoA carboxylase biotin carboxylase subunit [Candidatus Polarisedimenticolia bacterium]|nr:acetyl-CoA carboxylase biotin carboxylase subunit [Candidatus Polarisedimenticolia bacterium]
MFHKILIANRGEIAVRVIRACREAGVRSVAVFSEADRDALHVRYADEAYLIGPAEASRSYLSIEAIVAAAGRSGAEAVHPGYGFLSENAAFARACAAAGLVFIGPPAEAIAAMGDKVRARKLMKEAGVPLVPGTEGPVASAAELRSQAAAIGYPVLIKAAAGGGGRGMRVVRSEGEAESALAQAASEAGAAFGNPAVYVERYIERGRHIEVQVLADARGAIHLGERECSIQRRHQKLIEESPSPMVDAARRQQLGEAAVRAADAVGYRGAGTVEFLVDAEGRFYFMEMNTRLQVEHPVTEMVTGVDLVKAQLRVAAGEASGLSQDDVALRGSAIECRIYAEDPDRGFLPAPGRIERLRVPGGPGIRDDSGVYEGYALPIHYDPLISKLVAWGETRAEAIARMLRALDEYMVVGVPTTLSFHQRALRDERFVRGELHTRFVEEMNGRPPLAGGRAELLKDLALIAAALAQGRTPAAGGDHRGGPSAWRAAGRRRQMEGPGR